MNESQFYMTDDHIIRVMPFLGWPIPQDFDKQEREMLFDLCLQQQLSHTEAVEAITLLRLRSGECAKSTTQHYPVQDTTPHAVQSTITPRRYNYYDC